MYLTLPFRSPPNDVLDIACINTSKFKLHMSVTGNNIIYIYNICKYYILHVHVCDKNSSAGGLL